METGDFPIPERWCCCKFITCHQRATLFCNGEDGARCSNFSVGDTSDMSFIIGQKFFHSLSHDAENFYGHDKLSVFLREVRKCLVPAISLLFFMLKQSAVQRNYLLRLRLMGPVSTRTQGSQPADENGLKVPLPARIPYMDTK